MTSGNGTKVHEVIHCNCTPPWPLAPAGYCDRCGFEGPVRRVVMDDIRTQGSRSILSVMTDTVTSRKHKPINWREVWSEESRPVEWLVEPILEAGTINALFSKPGEGKSLVTMEMCLKVVRSGKIALMIDHENRVADLVERLRNFGCKPDELDNLITFSFAELPPLDTQEGGECLLEISDQYKPDLVTLDTISRLVQGDENSSNTYLDLYRNTLTLLKGRGICTLRLDHAGKDLAKGQRGSSAKDSDADTIWKLSRDGSDYIILERTKTRSGHGEPMVVLRKHQDPLRFEWDAIDDMVDGQVLQIAKRLDEYQVPLDWGRDRAESVLREHNINPGRHSTVGTALKYRRDQAKLSQDSQGQRDEWYR